jgi:hypothetical protein
MCHLSERVIGNPPGDGRRQHRVGTDVALLTQRRLNARRSRARTMRSTDPPARRSPIWPGKQHPVRRAHWAWEVQCLPVRYSSPFKSFSDLLKEEASPLMNNTIRKQHKKLTCPHCGQTFARPQALGGHIRYKHGSLTSPQPAQAEAKQVKKAATTPKPKSLVTAESLPSPVNVPAATPEVPPAGVSNNGAHDHLKTALEELTQCSRQIDEELSHMGALQAEKEIIRRQIDAVNSALQAFSG